jgi:hypothetical protein
MHFQSHILEVADSPKEELLGERGGEGLGSQIPYQMNRLIVVLNTLGVEFILLSGAI